jgi:quercetin dioxygenase-like cupin family protein
MATTLTLTPSESVTIRHSEPEMLEVEAVYGPAGSPPPKHLHPAQDEHFEVLEGALRVRLNDAERTLRPGETIDVPRGTAHQMWNPGSEQARVIWRTRPRGRTEEWFHALDGLQRAGRVGRNGMPGPLAFGVYLTEYRDVFQLAAGPQQLVRGALAVLGAIGRRRGYDAAAARGAGAAGS